MLAGFCAAGLFALTLASPAAGAPGPQTLRPATCSPAVSTYVTSMGKIVSKAYDEFNIGNPSRTEPLMKQAIKVARKARTAAAGETTKALLTDFINVGADKYRVSMMADALVKVQDHVFAGC